MNDYLHCESCGIFIQRYNWGRHKRSRRHLRSFKAHAQAIRSRELLKMPARSG